MNRLLILLALLFAGTASAQVTLVSDALLRDSTNEAQTAGAGSNRLVVTPVATESVSSAYSGGGFNPTFGGTGLTDIGTDPFVDNGNPDRLIGGYYLKEASIPSGEQTYALTETDITAWSGTFYTFAGVDQTTPIIDFEEQSQASATTWTTTAVTAPDDSIVVCAAVVATSFSPSSDVTTADYVDDDKNNNFSGFGVYTAHKVVATGGSESCTFDWDGNSEVGATLIFAVNPAAAASEPAFDVSPTVTATTDSTYTLGYTSDSAADFYAVACVPSETAPSAAQIMTGDCGSGNDAESSVTEAVTGADTTQLTGIVYPRHDLYAVLNNANGSSSVVTLADENRAARPGMQIIVLE